LVAKLERERSKIRSKYIEEPQAMPAEEGGDGTDRKINISAVIQTSIAQAPAEIGRN